MMGYSINLDIKSIKKNIHSSYNPFVLFNQKVKYKL